MNISSSTNSSKNIDATGFMTLKNQLGLLAGLLSDAIEQIGVELSEQQQRQLLLYLDKLLLWNKAYNLTAITEPKEALIKHIIDCLAIVPYLPSSDSHNSLLDIGTGAGLPGVVVAIYQPQRQCTLLDSNQKKIRFIKQVSSELGLTNVLAVASRIENYHDTHSVITSRAFASLSDFVTLAAPKLQAGGILQAMKGKMPEEDELASLQQIWQIKSLSLQVPLLSGSRHLIELSAKND